MKLRNRKKGFTLAEVLIVIAIIAILGALAIIGVSAYKKSMKVTELDNTARALLVSAQNHMTAAKASGKLKTIDISSQSNTTPYSDAATRLVDYDGTVPAHDFYAVVYNPGDTVQKNGLLDTMLPFGSIDDTVRAGYSYIIEVDWTTYTVYGVFVTDNKSGLDISVTAETDLRGDKDARKNHKPIVGYYGGAEAGALDESAELSVSIRIDNSEILKAEINDETYTPANNSLVTLTFTGKTSGVTARYNLNVGGGTAATFEAAGGSATDASASALSGANTVATNTNPDASVLGRVYTLILDDVKTAGRHFSQLFPFFEPGEDIVITASVSAGVSHEESASKMTNSLFDSSETEGTPGNAGSVFTAYVGNGRHLQNLEPAVSGITVADAADGLAERIHVVIINDIDWSAFFANDTEAVQTLTAGAVENGSYLSVNNSRISQILGKGHIISNLKLAPNDGAAGMLGKVTGEVGFFDLFLLDPTTVNQDSISYAGAFVGLADQSASITRCGVYNLNNAAYNSHAIAAGADGSVAGGLIGAWNNVSGSALDPVITESFASVQVTAKDTAGGLVGVSKVNATIVSSYSGGNVGSASANITSENGKAGGLVGSVTGNTLTLNATYSTASVSGRTAAGGLVGTVSGGALKAETGGSYAANEVKSGAVIGGAVGSLVSGGTFTATANVKVLMDSNHLVLIRWNNPDDPTHPYEAILPSLQDGEADHNASIIGNVAVDPANTGFVTSLGLNAAAASAARKYSAVDAAYPFPTVNSTNPASAASTYKHYGDWYAADYKEFAVSKKVDVENAVTSFDILMYEDGAARTEPRMEIEVSDGTRKFTVPLEAKYINNVTTDTEGTDIISVDYSFALQLSDGTYTVTENGRENAGMNHLDKATTTFTVYKNGAVNSSRKYDSALEEGETVTSGNVVPGTSAANNRVEIYNIYEGALTVDWLYDDPTDDNPEDPSTTAIENYKTLREDYVIFTYDTDTKVYSATIEPPVQKEFTNFMFAGWNYLKGDTMILLDQDSLLNSENSNYTIEDDEENHTRTITIDATVSATWDADGKLTINIKDDGTTEKYTFVETFETIGTLQVSIEYISLDNASRVLKTENYQIVAGDFEIELNIRDQLNGIEAYSLLAEGTNKDFTNFFTELGYTVGPKSTGDEAGGNVERKDDLNIAFHLPINNDTTLKVPVKGLAEVEYKIIHEFYNSDRTGLDESDIWELTLSGLKFDSEKVARIDTGELSDDYQNTYLKKLGEPIKGLPGSWTAINKDYALDVKGFTPIGVVNTQITPDGEAEVVIRYERNRYRVTYNFAGGLLNGQSNKQAEYYSYGESVPTPIAPKRAGYDFYKWEFSDGTDAGTGTVAAGGHFDMMNAEVTVTALWDVKTEASYIVEYWVQSVNDSYKTSNENKTYEYHCKTVIPGGQVGSAVSLADLGELAENIPADIKIDDYYKYTVKMLEYNAANTDSRGRRDSAGNVITIEADGTTTYKIFYDRKVVTYKFKYSTGHSPSINTRAITTRTFEQVTKDGIYAVYNPVTDGQPYDHWQQENGKYWFGHKQWYTVVEDAKYDPVTDDQPYHHWNYDEPTKTWWFGNGQFVRSDEPLADWYPTDYNYTWTETGNYHDPDDYFDWFVSEGYGYYRTWRKISDEAAVNNPNAVYAHGTRQQGGGNNYSISNQMTGVAAPVKWVPDGNGRWHIDGYYVYSAPEEYYGWYRFEGYSYWGDELYTKLDECPAGSLDGVVYGHGTQYYGSYYTVEGTITGADGSAVWVKEGNIWRLYGRKFVGDRYKNAVYGRDNWQEGTDGIMRFGYEANFDFNASYPNDKWYDVEGEGMQFGHWNEDNTPRFMGLYESPFFTGWRCKDENCSYEYDNKILPEDYTCPECGHDAYNFEQVVIWRCNGRNCSYEYEGKNSPYRCPYCRSTSFTKIEGWRCKDENCRYLFQGSILPDDYVCPQCGQEAYHFEPIPPAYDWDTGYTWQFYDQRDKQTMTMTFLDSFSIEDTTFTDVGSNQGGSLIVHYIEKLNDDETQAASLNNRTWEARVSTPSSGGTFNFSNKFYGFKVAGYNHDKNGSITATNENGSTSIGTLLNVYHARSSYELQFANVKTDSLESLSLLYESHYEGKLPTAEEMNANKAQYIPEGTESDFIFEGWYKSETYEESERVSSSDVMPAYTKVVFAHWIPPQYTVEFVHIDDDGTVKTLADSLTVTKMDKPANNSALVAALTNAKNNAVLPAGFIFEGWYRDAEFTQPYDASELSQDPIIADTTLYARYKQVSGKKSIEVRYVTPEGTYFEVTENGVVVESSDGGYSIKTDRNDEGAFFYVEGTIGENLEIIPPNYLISYAPSENNNTIVGVTADLVYIDLYYDYVENWSYVVRGYLRLESGDPVLLYKEEVTTTDEWRVVVVRQFDGFIFDGNYYYFTVEKDTDYIAQNKAQEFDLYYRKNTEFWPELTGAYTFDANNTSGWAEYNGLSHAIVAGGTLPDNVKDNISVAYKDSNGELVVDENNTLIAPKEVGNYTAVVNISITVPDPEGGDNNTIIPLWTREVALEIKPWEYEVKLVWNNGSDNVLLNTLKRAATTYTVRIPYSPEEGQAVDTTQYVLAADLEVPGFTYRTATLPITANVAQSHTYTVNYDLDSTYELQFESDKYEIKYSEGTASGTRAYDGTQDGVRVALPDVLISAFAGDNNTSRLQTEITYYKVNGDGTTSVLTAPPVEVGSYKAVAAVKLDGNTTLWTRSIDLTIGAWKYDVDLVLQIGDKEYLLKTLTRETGASEVAIPYVPAADETVDAGAIVLAADLEIPGFKIVEASKDLMAKVEDEDHTYTVYYDIDKTYALQFASTDFTIDTAGTSGTRVYDSNEGSVSVVLPEALTSVLGSRLTTVITYTTYINGTRYTLPAGNLPALPVEVGSYQARAAVKLDDITEPLWEGSIDLTVEPWTYTVNFTDVDGSTNTITGQSTEAEVIFTKEWINADGTKAHSTYTINVSDGTGKTYNHTWPADTLVGDVFCGAYVFDAAGTGTIVYDGRGHELTVNGQTPSKYLKVNENGEEVTVDVPLEPGKYVARFGSGQSAKNVDLVICFWQYTVSLVDSETETVIAAFVKYATDHTMEPKNGVNVPTETAYVTYTAPEIEGFVLAEGQEAQVTVDKNDPSVTIKYTVKPVESEPADGEGTGNNSGEPADGEGTGNNGGESADGEGTGNNSGESADGEGTGNNSGEPSDGEGTGNNSGEPADGEGTGNNSGEPANGEGDVTPTDPDDQPANVEQPVVENTPAETPVVEEEDEENHTEAPVTEAGDEEENAGN